MRQLNVRSVRGALTGLREALPTVTRKRVVGASVVAVLGGGAYALFVSRPSRMRKQWIRSGLRCVTDGPTGYVVVSTNGPTFLVPVSQRAMVESYKDSGELMPFTLGVEIIDGLRVGTLS